MTRISMSWPKPSETQDDTLTPQASAPSSPSEGEMYLNSTDDKVYIYYDETWQVLHTLTVTDKLLLETGDYVLLETGSQILLEA